MGDDYISITEATRLVGCSRGLVRRRIEDGLVATFTDPRDHRKVLIRRADITSVMAPRPRLIEIPSKQMAAGVAA